MGKWSSDAELDRESLGGGASDLAPTGGVEAPCGPPPLPLLVDLSLEIRTAQNVPLALEPASIGERILATILDGILATAYVIAALWIGAEIGIDSIAVFVLLIGVPYLGYHLAFEVFFEGRTPGKMATRTRVARLDGAQPTLGQYLLRWLLRFVDLSFSSGVVALLSVALTKRSQRLGDLAAGTTVVRQRRRVQLRHVLYPEVPDGYDPAFPEAEALTDAEIRIVRAVLTKIALTSRNARSEALARRAKAAVERRLGLEAVQMPAVPFLRTIVRDHVARLDRFGG